MFVTCVTQEGNICTTTFNMSIHVKHVTLLKKTLATHVTSKMLLGCFVPHNLFSDKSSYVVIAMYKTYGDQAGFNVKNIC